MQYIKNAGIVLAICLAIIQVWNWMTAPQMSLHASVEFAPVQFPPTLEDEFQRLHAQVEEDSLRKMADIPSLVFDADPARVEKALERAVQRLSLELKHSTPRDVPYEISTLNGIYWLTVANDGSAALSDVRITLPHEALVQIRRPGQDGIVIETADVIDIGKMQPMESIGLVVWSPHSPSRYQAEDIRLTHANGIGSVSIRTLASPFAQWIDAFWPLLLLVISMILAWTLVLVMPIFVSTIRRSAINQSDEKAGDKTQHQAATHDVAGAQPSD